MPSGGKSWRIGYRHAGKQKRLVIGLYPAITLAEARSERDAAKSLLAKGLDPAGQKKLEMLDQARREAATFEVVAKELLTKERKEGKAAATLAKKRWLVLDLASALAKRPIAEISAPELLSVLRKVEDQGKRETARRLRSACGQVFRHAIAMGRAERDPSTDLRGALTAPITRHRAALQEPGEIGAFWRAVDGYVGQPETRLALKFALLTAARPGEVRTAEWREIDCDEAQWSIPADKTKMRRLHRIPLSDQALSVLRELEKLTGDGRYLFPSVRSFHRPMSEGTMVAALRRMGYGKDEISAHGFRSMFSTHANESRLWDGDVIETALAHQDRDAVRRAYNRAQQWDARTRLMQWWADELDRLAAGEEEKVLPFRARTW